jgi:hypothetical protein
MAVIAAGGHAPGLCVRLRRLTNMYSAQVRLRLHLDSIAEVMGDRPRFIQCGKAGRPSSTGEQGRIQPTQVNGKRGLSDITLLLLMRGLGEYGAG